MTAVRIRAVVTGRVQGVGFRYSTRVEATRLGLSGFARNDGDGTVRVEAEGDEVAVDSLIRWLSQGPPAARVDGVAVESIPTTGSSGFRTA